MKVTLKMWDGKEIKDVILYQVKEIIRVNSEMRAIFRSVPRGHSTEGKNPDAKTISYPIEMFFAAIEEWGNNEDKGS